MNWIIITSLVVFFIIGVFLFIINPDNYKEFISGKIWGFIVCIFASAFFSLIFGGLVSGFICFMGKTSLKTEERVTQSYELVALDTNEDVNGSYNSLFFVGSGYIGEDMYYHFYYSTPQGIKYKKELSENCFIIETNEKPSYKIYGIYYKDKNSTFYDSSLIRETRKVLYIPKGTIKSNYKVN